ncbi:UBX domain-containing protein 4 [Drosophila grimshawi]|uniref:UBX domain-containing protein 4 n=1 Tax=Drosophila grimshawi TaxID=7222 RepID=B4J106_DROGR|nr:UBX domain-containing protein 4 [Drosophila grimshawi]EDV96861.1 GH16507 [Drosophila grimshawi]
MNWHTGNIAEAVAESKAKDAVFVVYITGQDEMSANLDRLLNDSLIHTKLQTSDFVAVKIQGNSETYVQFSSLYKVVPVPSIFFIGKSGTPLDIATGIVASVEELVAKIDKVLLLAGKRTNPDTPTSSGAVVSNESSRSIAGADNEDAPTQKTEPIKTVDVSESEVTDQESVPAAEAAAKPVVVAVESTALPEPAARVAVVPPEPTASSVSAAAAAEKRAASAAAAATAHTATSAATSMLPTPIQNIALQTPLVPTALPGEAPTTRSTAEEAVLQTTDIQSLVAQRRKEREEEQKQRDKENELRRRREGRESQAQQTLTRDQELKKLQERIKRERQQEQQTRERILAQIAADRAEHASNRRSLTADVPSTTSNSTATTDSVRSTDWSHNAGTETRLQIRLPGGTTRTQTFPAAETLSTVRKFVLDELLAGSNIREFTMATSYPRREFKSDDETKTLNELNLVPNAVLLVLHSEQVNRVVRSRNSLFNMLTSIIWAIFTPAAMAFDYMNRMGLQRLRQRFNQMMGWTKPDEDNRQARDDVTARRNMDMFLLRTTQRPGLQQSAPQNVAGSESGSQPSGKSVPTEDASQGQEVGQPRSVGYKPPRYGESNIRRLADTKDEDEDKATYNGNSTQQQ